MMASSFMMLYIEFFFAIIAAIDKGKFFTQVYAMYYTIYLIL